VANKSDTFNVKAFNALARDTSVQAPFTLTGANGAIFTHDATNLHMKKGCQ